MLVMGGFSAFGLSAKLKASVVLFSPMSWAVEAMNAELTIIYMRPDGSFKCPHKLNNFSQIL